MADTQCRANLTRRSLVAAGSLGALVPTIASAAGARRFEDPATKGVAGYSESAMVVFVDPSQRLAASLRVCRFPPLGLAWIWNHVLTPTGFLSYIHHLGDCGPDQAFSQTQRADFSTRAHGARADLVRTGSDGAVQAVDFNAAIDFRQETDAALGPGSRRGRLRGRFEPTHLHVGKTDTGRREQVGRIDAVVEVGGQRYAFNGPGKYHEQAQTGPRFVAPFSYLAYWGAAGSGVAIKSPTGGSGAILTDGASAFVTGFRPDPPSASRRAEIVRDAQPVLQADLQALVRFSFPIFGETWRGSFVEGLVGDQRVVGQFNDWGAERLTYAPR